MGQGRLSSKKLAASVGIAYPILIKKAKEGGCITYKDLLIDMVRHPGMGYIGQVLNRIGELERAVGRPKLSAVVVLVHTGKVSGGFFGLPDTPKHLKRTSPQEWRNENLSVADCDYWRKELARVHAWPYTDP